uniref:ANAPC4_WD40 domain-containing protein n=1 Tax=Heterorhabditis bacteriophora TaxID=37862 RepID=A0A1I7WGG2_HETBA
MNTCSEDISDHGEIFDLEWCRRQRWPSQNQVAMIAERERGHARRGIRHCRNYRDMYSTVPLDRFVQIPEARHTQDNIISWTPDGQRLIAFHTNLRVVHIYKYLGVERAKSSTIDTICKVI